MDEGLTITIKLSKQPRGCAGVGEVLGGIVGHLAAVSERYGGIPEFGYDSADVTLRVASSYNPATDRPPVGPQHPPLNAV